MVQKNTRRCLEGIDKGLKLLFLCGGSFFFVWKKDNSQDDKDETDEKDIEKIFVHTEEGDYLPVGPISSQASVRSASRRRSSSFSGSWMASRTSSSVRPK